MKKINIYIILGIVALVGLVIFILFSFGVIKTTSSDKTTFSEIKVGEKVFFPYLSQDGTSFYYFGDQGVKLKKFNFQTQKTEVLYPDDILFTYDTLWSPDEDKLIIKNNQPYANTSSQLLDIKSKKITDLNKNIKNIIWSSDSKKLYYQYFETENNKNYLAMTDINSLIEEKLIDLKYLDYDFLWLNNFQELGYWSTPQDIGGTRLYAINVYDKKVRTILDNYILNEASSSYNGQYFTYSHYYEKDNLVKMSYAKYDGTDNKDLNYQTSIQKTAWAADSSFFIVAVREKKTENDKFYKIEVKNNKITNLSYSTDKNQDLIYAENLMLSPDNKTLYFTSNDILYSLNLP